MTSLLVIFVALFGLRLALGGAVTLRDGVLAVLKIGIVLTLATSWPAYQTVVYGLVVDGPRELLTAISSAGPTSASDNLIGRLASTDRAIIQLTSLGTGREEFAALPPAAGAPAGAVPQRFPTADNPAFGWARIVFLSSAVAAFAAIRVLAGVLLALTPLFAAFLLFGVAHGLLVGWARALVFTILASIAAAILLGIELALLQPWLEQTIALRRAQAVTASAPVELLVLCLGFAAALLGALVTLLRVAFMVHIPGQIALPWFTRHNRAEAPEVQARNPVTPWERPSVEPAPSRALVVADAVAATQRRESARIRSLAAGRAGVPANRSGPVAAGASDELIIPSFGSASRRARPRTSLGARLRDRRS